MTAKLEQLLSDMRQYGTGSDDGYRQFAVNIAQEMSRPGANWAEVLARAFQSVADNVNDQRDTAAFYEALTEPY